MFESKGLGYFLAMEVIGVAASIIIGLIDPTNSGSRAWVTTIMLIAVSIGVMVAVMCFIIYDLFLEYVPAGIVALAVVVFVGLWIVNANIKISLSRAPYDNAAGLIWLATAVGIVTAVVATIGAMAVDQDL